MEKFHLKTPVASVADHLFRLLITCAIGSAWFVYLWGGRLASLTAGIGLGGLFWLCARQFGKMSTQKREKQMRRLIGGELALDELLLQSPRHAGFQAAMWVTQRFSFQMEKAVNWGVIGTLSGVPTLVWVIAQHESQTVTAQQVINVIREAKAFQMQRCILCLTAKLSREAMDYAMQSNMPIHILQRSEMIELAGACAPATDEQLSQIRKRQKIRRNKQEWLQMVFNPSRARRYFIYGLGLSVLALLTGMQFYLFPAILCLLLFMLTKGSTARFRARVGKGDPFQNR